MIIWYSIIAIVLHFVIFGLPPIINSFFNDRLDQTLIYAYIGSLFTLVQIFDSLYGIQITENLVLNGGDIAYSALVFTSLYLILISDDPPVTGRKLVFTVSMTSIFLFLLFGTISLSVNNQSSIDFIGVSEIFLQFSFLSMLLSFALFLTEILFIIILVKRLLLEKTGLIKQGMIIMFIYTAVLLLDGILYPIGINLIHPEIQISLVGSIIAKLIFGLGFGNLLLILVSMQERGIAEFIDQRFHVKDFLVPPHISHLQNKLDDAEDTIRKLKQITPICAHCKNIRNDDGYWDRLEKFMQNLNDQIIFSHSVCPDCAEIHYKTSL